MLPPQVYRVDPTPSRSLASTLWYIIVPGYMMQQLMCPLQCRCCISKNLDRHLVVKLNLQCSYFQSVSYDSCSAF